MNAPARAGDHRIVGQQQPQPRRWSWSATITTTIICVLLIAAAHLAQFGPAIDNPSAITDIGKYLCTGNDGLRRITLRAQPRTYTFTCRDGAVHPDVRIHITEPTITEPTT